MLLTIRRESGRFEVVDNAAPGSPPIGYGHTMMEAIGRWFHSNQTKIGLDFIVEDSAKPAEMRRRRRELARR